MDLGLNNKRILITGASRGLGGATALVLAAEGARLVINSRGQENLDQRAIAIRQQTGSEVYTVAGDITNPDFPSSLVQQAVHYLGGLDILITNAGGPPAGKFESFDDNTWQRAIELSLMSHVRLIRASLPYLRESKDASVLTITSYSVKQPIPNLVLSNSIRAATVGLTKSLALELGSEGIRFNSILPAWIETERITELMTFRAKANQTTLEEELQKQAKESSLGRVGRPDEFARAAAFLVSHAASYITGVMLTVDGGMYKGTF
ncbi:MAG TPA: SDR family oxidoreductase [Anaerolineaceae bacterium]